ncbi:MAG: GldM family protein [Saprospiraceae bacterium]
MKKSIQMLVLVFLISINFLNAQHATVANTKMNVVYIGVDNPISVAISGYSAEDIDVQVSDGEIEGKAGKYIWRVSTPGNAKITVSANGQVIETFDYRIKRIPDPVAVVGKTMSGSISAATLKAQSGVNSVINNFDFDARCETVSYVITVVRKNADPIDSPNKGAAFSGTARSLINMVQAGDIVYIENVRCRCPGDAAARKINSIVLKIK